MTVNLGIDRVNFESPVAPAQVKAGVDYINLEIPIAVTQLKIGVDVINLEIPVTGQTIETITNTQESTQTIEEEIIGTPVPEPAVVVGGAGQRIRVIGGRPWIEESIYSSSHAIQSIDEEILVGEIVETYANNVSEISAKIRRPIYAKPRRIEILSFTPHSEKTIQIPIEEPKINRRQKEEEELLLLGII